MMNVLALGLVLTSLVTAGFFSPSPEKQSSNQEDVIVKEGHRVVVVEFEKDDGSTKVSISPHESQSAHKVDDEMSLGNAKEKLFEKMEDTKEKIKDLVPDVGSAKQEEQIRHGFNPRELVCDAYGKCKHKIASAIGRAKELVADEAQEVEEEAKETIGKVEDMVTGTAHKVADKAEDIKEHGKDKVVEKAGEFKEGAREQAGRTKKVKDEVMKDASEKMEGAKENLAEKAKKGEEMVESVANKVKEGASNVKKEGKKEFSEISRCAREVLVDVFGYVVSPDRLATITGVLHLMGFATAYGMCVWVTFASSYVLAGALPRNQFAMVQSKIYPVYFKAMVYSVGLALLGHIMGLKRISIYSAVFESFNLLASLGMILMNLLYLEPRATKVIFERMKKEKEGTAKGHSTTTTSVSSGGRVVDSAAEAAGRSTQEKPEEMAAKSEMVRLNEILHRLNSYSSLLNILTLMSLMWHLVHLGQRLHVAC